MKKVSIIAMLVILVLATLACLGGKSEPEVDVAATQRSLESTQNALSLQAEKPTSPPPPTAAPAEDGGDSDGDSGGNTSGSAAFRLSSQKYTDPAGLFDFYPPEGWTDGSSEGEAIFYEETGDAEGTIVIEATYTGHVLDAEAFANFVDAREFSFFQWRWSGYGQTYYDVDGANGVAEVTKNLMYDGRPQTVYTLYFQLDNAIFTFDCWAARDYFDDYMVVYQEMLDGTNVYTNGIQNQWLYNWQYEFFGPNDLFSFQVPYPFDYEYNDTGDTVVDTFYSPDGHFIVQSIYSDDGTYISKSVAGQLALFILNDLYTDDIKITGDEVQSDGSERLNWYSPSGGYTGESFFEIRPNSHGEYTTFLMLTFMWDDAYESTYVDLETQIINSYYIP